MDASKHNYWRYHHLFASQPIRFMLKKNHIACKVYSHCLWEISKLLWKFWNGSYPLYVERPEQNGCPWHDRFSLVHFVHRKSSFILISMIFFPWCPICNSALVCNLLGKFQVIVWCSVGEDHIVDWLIPAWISNLMPSKVWDEITYPFPNFNGCTSIKVSQITASYTFFLTIQADSKEISKPSLCVVMLKMYPCLKFFECRKINWDASVFSSNW